MKDHNQNLATFSVGRLARAFELSRSTLLYYDSIGLLKPSARSEKGYRLYSQEDRARLEQICLYRQMGVPLQQIKEILDLSGSGVAAILENRLVRLSAEIRSLRQQQYVIVNMLQNRNLLQKAGLMDKTMWMEILRSSGLDEEGMKQWHVAFEKQAPRAHHDFLAALGIGERAIREIRGWET